MKKKPIDKRIIVGVALAIIAVIVVIIIIINAKGKKNSSTVSGRQERTSDVTDVVTVDQGKLTGIYNNEGTVALYAGVPYAKPPVGELRWKEPVEPESWDGVRACDTFEAMSMQSPQSAMLLNIDYCLKDYNNLSIKTDENGNALCSEDSLYLNIFVPSDAKPGDDLPVIMFFHGGSLNSGQSYYPDQNGTTMAENGVIFITVPYRLGVFGYLATEELAKESENGTTGNYGLLDQIQALRWVSENIEAFGGDASNITLAGQSAGASAVNAMCVSPLCKGLFSKAIGESSSITGVNPPHTFRTYSEAVKTGNEIMNVHGANSIENMRSINAEELLNDMAVNTAMTIDGYALTEMPYITYEKGNNNESALLSGYNANESMVYLMGETGVTTTNYINVINNCVGGHGETIAKILPANTDEEALQNYMRIYGVAKFGYSHYAWSKALTDNGCNAYLYYFAKDNGMSSNWHAGEQAYAYGNLDRSEIMHDETDEELSSIMTSYWVNFAKNGDPNGKGLPEWKSFNDAKNQIMVFDTESSMKYNEDIELMMEIHNYQQSLK